MKQCEKCGNIRDEKFFEDGNAICNYCVAEMENLDGEILTGENTGEIIQKKFLESKKEVQKNG